MQRYRDEIARIKKAQEEERERDTQEQTPRQAPEKAISQELSGEMTSKVLSQAITRNRENSVLGYATSLDITSFHHIWSDDGRENKTNTKKKSAGRYSARDRGKKVGNETEQNFRHLRSPEKFDEASLPVVREVENKKNSDQNLSINISAMVLSLEPPRQPKYKADRTGRLRKQLKRHLSNEKKGVVSTNRMAFVSTCVTNQRSGVYFFL
jgi:hypothetical protein